METGPYLKAWTPISPVVTELWIKYASNSKEDDRLTKVVKAITDIRLKRTGRGDSPEIIEQAIQKFLNVNGYQGKKGLEKAITSRLGNTIAKQMDQDQKEINYRMARLPDQQFRGSDNRTAEQIVQHPLPSRPRGGVSEKSAPLHPHFLQTIGLVIRYTYLADAA